ncbi:3-oxoacyl-[acyl-carrier-protein] synthase, KASII [Kocuria palustris PEL]|uniref:3-oxoacyl-[acyl-carrier-protein] synthase, KASII n=1 Tax=Kocuria palustris PEL TaxID=1236550 RepID=M2WEV4_9MICC|nr:beta-ketoacyl-[acyl-carrier-protein] synthase family protein [Kocuria palustris]EME37067.1 3-oxoacyl-[acyl-carrier-protein] synthase, KASII [Kocuria palustris PEL]
MSPAQTARRRVVITGAGAVTPLGLDAESTLESLVAGRSGVREITQFDASTYPVRIAGTVPVEDARTLVPDVAEAELLSRQGAFGVAAGLEALRRSGLPAARDEDEADRRTVVVGATAGRPDLQEMAEFFHRVKAELPLHRPLIEDVLRRDQNIPAAVLAREAGFRGAVESVSTACTASGHAIGEAFRQIQEGEADAALAGGYDSLVTWLDVLGFSLLGALTKDHADEPERASRPFSDDRSGFVLGEGGIMLVLEERESALRRGAPILGEMAGYAATMNAYRMTDPPPPGGGVTQCMVRAVEDSGVPAERIGYIAAHGTSTPGNDVSESQAVREVFGAHAGELVMTSVKSMSGHLTAAASALGTLGALGVLADGRVPPTINLENPDPDCDLDYAPQPGRVLDTDAVLVNAFAFGGTNACTVITRHVDDAAQPARPADEEAAR